MSRRNKGANSGESRRATAFWSWMPTSRSEPKQETEQSSRMQHGPLLTPFPKHVHPTNRELPTAARNHGTQQSNSSADWWFSPSLWMKLSPICCSDSRALLALKLKPELSWRACNVQLFLGLVFSIWSGIVLQSFLQPHRDFTRHPRPD